MIWDVCFLSAHGGTWPRCVFLAVALMGVASNGLFAHPGGHDSASDAASSRTWTLAAEGAHFHGSFVAAEGDKVRILREDGVVTTIEIGRLTASDQQWIARRTAEIRRVNTQAPATLVAQLTPRERTARETTAKNNLQPPQALAFVPFAKSVKVRWDRDYLFVESNGIPDHPMMIGIRSWQQQVPLPQKYFGDNAWQIPLNPVPAARPASAKNRFLRGAIALAVNGIPIFNPLNNRGDDAYLFGELDQYGGHCGRADDYHYHITPTHLEQVTGKGKVLAYALDGYPIYGYEEPDGSKVVGLDPLNGHTDAHGNYHYHATKTYPYLNGGFHGEVTERDEQVDPQPRAQPIREYLQPLAGAKITNFKSPAANRYELTYEVNGKPGYVRYVLNESGKVDFTFVDPSGKSTSESYSPRGQRSPGKKKDDRGPPRRENDRPPPPGGGNDRPPPPRDEQGKARGPAPDGVRKPWISEHFTELDADADQILTRDEMQAEANRTFAAYDTNRDGKLDRAEYDRGGVKQAFAGFVRGHAAEVDASGDGVITKQELLDFATQLFEKADRDRDGKTTPSEAAVMGPGKRPPGEDQSQ